MIRLGLGREERPAREPNARLRSTAALSLLTSPGVAVGRLLGDGLLLLPSTTGYG